MYECHQLLDRVGGPDNDVDDDDDDDASSHHGACLVCANGVCFANLCEKKGKKKTAIVCQNKYEGKTELKPDRLTAFNALRFETKKKENFRHFQRQMVFVEIENV